MMDINENLVLETSAFRNNIFDVQEWGAVVEALPIIGLALNVSKWSFRVRLSKNQAIIAINTPKGYMISFEQCEKFIRVPAFLNTEEIYSLLIEGITDVINRSKCITAINMVKAAIYKDNNNNNYLRKEFD